MLAYDILKSNKDLLTEISQVDIGKAIKLCKPHIKRKFYAITDPYK